LLYPGPPYLLHEADYENVELVERVSDVFRVGPYEFITVKDGQIAGAYGKMDGKFRYHSNQCNQRQFNGIRYCPSAVIIARLFASFH
jgi:hypothetical protein